MTTAAVKQDDLDEADRLVTDAMGCPPARIERQRLTNSGNDIYRVDLPDGRSVVLRVSARPKTFAHTRHNLSVLASLGLPVQAHVASGPTATGGSYVILTWTPGQDLACEMPGMSRTQLAVLARQTVECQRRVSGLPPAGRFGWAPIGRNGSLRCWAEMFGPPAAPENTEDGTPIDRLTARLCTLRQRVEPYFVTVLPRPFLDDLTTRNVLVDDGALSGVIDVDFVCHGDPLLAIGATMASVASDLPAADDFYGEELIRCWDPTPVEQLAVRFYAALWGVGILRQFDRAAEPARARSLERRVSAWLDVADGQ